MLTLSYHFFNAHCSMNVKWNVFVIAYILLTNTNADELDHSPEIPYFLKTVKWSPHCSKTDSANIRIFVLFRHKSIFTVPSANPTRA